MFGTSSDSAAASTVAQRIASFVPELVKWRHDLHRHPELLYDVQWTADFVAKKLVSFGCDEVVRGLGRTGVVAVIKGQRTASGRVIGLRADMDALPIEEETELSHSSELAGRMHACGHDGHMAMLLGAAAILSESRAFDGTVVLVFQPAEEGGAGARAMLDDKLVERFGIDQIYGIHNMPGIPVGHFALREGPIMAASDRFRVVISGRGGHAAKPHETIDPILAASHIITSLQSITSRSMDPLDAAVVSVTGIHAGSAYNIISPTLEFSGTVRSLDSQTRDLCESRLRDLVTSIAGGFGARAEIEYARGYPVTRNHAHATSLAAQAAAATVGVTAVIPDISPIMAAEDFSFMLERLPGAFVFLGNGDSAGLHHPAYDFADAAIPHGVAFWIRLTEMAMPL